MRADAFAIISSARASTSESERVIQRLLAEAGVAGAASGVVSVDASGVEAPADWANLKSPENYLGLRAHAELRVAGRRRAGSTSHLCRACADGAQSVGAGRRVDDWQSGDRAEQARRADRVPLSLARSSSRHGSVTARSLGAFPGVDRRTAAGRCSRRRRGRGRQRYGGRTAVVSADPTAGSRSSIDSSRSSSSMLEWRRSPSHSANQRSRPGVRWRSRHLRCEYGG